ncbi:hypothetical protein [Nocardioides panacisoli]|uniref:Uncharacterized protein n=1 Tax=Nocardioides panacisoli TaxID=627624 RepID=A0ABP7I8Z2_9ACTN
MSVLDAPDRTGATPRVREQARDVLVLMAFSAGVSLSVALLLLLVSGLGR